MKIIVLTMALLMGVNSETTKIDAGNGVDRGSWGQEEMCPLGSYAAAMEFKYERRQHADDTCGNGLKLYCFTEAGQLAGYVTSSEGKFGSWQGIQMCPIGNFITGYAMKAEGDVGNFDDDLGVIDVRTKCEDGTILDGLEQQPAQSSSNTRPFSISKGPSRGKLINPLIYKLTEEDIERLSNNKGLNFGKLSRGSEDGYWGPIASCPTGTKVCGIQTQVEHEHIYSDDAGLCDVVLFCCD